ncbi:exonuclease 1 [Tanacetum coccineum]
MLKQFNIFRLCLCGWTAQITYLYSNKGIVDIIVGQDSDFIVYGCDHVLYKLKRIRSCLIGMCLHQALPGVGFETTYDLVLEHKDYSQAITHLKSREFNVPDSYEENCKKALITFRHHMVYDSESETATYVCPLDNRNEDDLSFIGEYH